MPSTVSFRATLTVPALLTRMSSRGQRARTVAASWRIDACEERSHSTNSTASGSAPERRRMSAKAAVFAWFRPTSTTLAPARARATAVSSPRPLLAPVTMAVFPVRPAIAGVGSGIAVLVPLEEATQQGAGDGDRVVNERGSLPARLMGSRATPSWRNAVPRSKYTRSQTSASPSNSKTSAIRKHTVRPVAGRPRHMPVCVPVKVPSTSTTSSAGAVRLEVEIRERHAVLVQQPVYAVPAVVDFARWDDFVAWVPECGDAAIKVVRVLEMHVLEHDRQPALRGWRLVFRYGRSLVPTHGSSVVGTPQVGSRQSSDRQVTIRRPAITVSRAPGRAVGSPRRSRGCRSRGSSRAE